MIKVVFVLIVLFLSVIFAYFAFANNKSVTSSKINEETVLPSVTEKAQSIQTESPEDKGTCEVTGDWAMSGKCEVTGTAIFTQTYNESKPGACPSNEKARVKPCCYQKGDWKDVGECQMTGKKKQEQTTVNCAENFKTRDVDCEYVGPWIKLGECNIGGTQTYNRTVVNSDATPNKTEKCCYMSDWSNWSGWSGCSGSSNGGYKKYRTRTRTIFNCPAGTKDKETEDRSCPPPGK